MSLVIYQLGSVTFEIMGMSATKLSRNTSFRHAEKPVLGRRPPLEKIGEGAETITISAKIYNEVLGGLDAISVMDEQRSSGSAFPLMRADGAAMGYFVIEGFSEDHSFIDDGGVGRDIGIELKLKKSSRQGVNSGSISQIISLFSGAGVNSTLTGAIERFNPGGR